MFSKVASYGLYRRKTNSSFLRQILELNFLTFIFHYTILKAWTPISPQSFDLDLEERKGPGDKDGKNAESSNEWSFVIYPASLISDINFYITNSVVRY